MKFSKRKIFSTIVLSFFVAVIVLTAAIPSIASAAENECISYATINIPAIGELSMPAGLNFLACLDDVAKWIGNLLLEIGGWVLWLSGIFLNVVISYTLLGMKELIDNTDGINVAWRAFRDLANMFFIFVILYIAIMTILRLDTSESKRLLVHVIIVALLLNFSMFFTKVIIDVSNTVTIGFYDTLTGNLPTEDPNIGLSGVFMEHLQLQGLYDASGASSVLGGAKIALNILLMGFLGMILFLILAFLFFAVSILLIARFIILIFLMILSPLAFAAMALPKDDYSRKWWDALFSQVIWVPVFFAMIWATLIVLDGLIPDTAGVAWTGLVTGGNENEAPNPSTIVLLLNFMIIIGLAVFSLIAAKQIGAVGSGTMVNWGRKTASYIGGGVGAATARTALRGFGAEYWGDKLREKGEKLRDAPQSSRFSKGLGTGLRVAGMGTQALSLRKLHEKAQQSQAFQSWPLQAPMEATLGALVTKKIRGVSAEDAYKQDDELSNRRRAIKELNAARRAERELKRSQTPASKEKIKEAEERIKKMENFINEKLYTPEMKKAREEKQSAKTEMEALRESLNRLTEEMASREGKEPQPENKNQPAIKTPSANEATKPQTSGPEIISTEDEDWKRRRGE